GGRCKALLHDGNQRLDASEVFRFRAFGEHRRGFGNARGAVVICLVHGNAPYFALPLIACQTRSGVAGISSLLLPIASVIALITAADAPIAPASPQPLTPSGLPGQSVVVCDSLNDGKSSARGMV